MRAYLWRGLAYEKTGDAYRAFADFQATLAVTEGRKDDREEAQGVARERLRVLEAARRQPVTVASTAGGLPQERGCPAQGRA